MNIEKTANKNGNNNNNSNSQYSHTCNIMVHAHFGRLFCWYICRLRLCQFAIGLLVCLRLVGVCLFVDLRLMAYAYMFSGIHTSTDMGLCTFFYSVNVYIPYVVVQQLVRSDAHTWICVCLCRVLMRRLTCMESLLWYWTYTFLLACSHSHSRARNHLTASSLFLDWIRVKFCFHLWRWMCWCEREKLLIPCRVDKG